MRRSALVGLFLVLMSSPTYAQSASASDVPRWGGELCVSCGATLLRFRNPNSAWLLGGSASYTHLHSETTSPFGPGDIENTDAFSATLRAGIRFYHGPQLGMRPFTSFAALVGFTTGDFDAVRYGTTGELGASYFFTSHVSLGVSASLTLDVLQSKRTFSSATVQDRYVNVAFDGVNLLAAVYF